MPSDSDTMGVPIGAISTPRSSRAGLVGSGLELTDCVGNRPSTGAAWGWKKRCQTRKPSKATTPRVNMLMPICWISLPGLRPEGDSGCESLVSRGVFSSISFTSEKFTVFSKQCTVESGFMARVRRNRIELYSVKGAKIGGGEKVLNWL